MNLHGIVAGAIGAVNPATEIEIIASAGYTTDATGRQVPAYADPVRLWAQVQSLTSTELTKLDGLNIQGASYSVFLDGRWNGVLRPLSKGGDLMRFQGETWLVVAVLEQWPDWSRVAVTLQNRRSA